MLTLAAVPGVWRLFATRREDPAFSTFHAKILARDHNTCQYCGFQAPCHQEIINRDHDYRNNKPENLMTACAFCTQCLFLEAAGHGNEGGGTLIYLPEIAQADLNGLCHVLFCAIANATVYRTDAQNVYRTLKLRAALVEEKLGEKMSDPAVLGQLLIDTGLGCEQIANDHVLRHLRLLPSRTRFARHIEAWAEAALKELAPEKASEKSTKK